MSLRDIGFEPCKESWLYSSTCKIDVDYWNIMVWKHGEERMDYFANSLINQSTLFAMIPAHPSLERRSANQSAAQNTSELDFRFPIGAPIHGILAFLSTNKIKTYDKARNALAFALSPVVRALVDPDGALSDVRNLDSISFSDWFMSKGGTRTSIQRMSDPVAYALGFTG
ncbi:zeta-carotene desaturase, chloroplastic/chromoplastic-like, partial [Rosa chinensis]|uniref:zeta-carotene desaturase, chloroplastic/chromoplastic-like n=1 Tax=Rosa chinensis TaxID=74649 RepID=UPI001AD919F1